MNQIDEILPDAGFPSRSDFIHTALSLYYAYVKECLDEECEFEC